MSASAKTVQFRPNAPDRHDDRSARAALAISGALFTVIGAVLAIGGYLSADGSAFPMLAGLGLIVSGALLARRHWVGAATYMLVFAGTVTWSLRNIELGSSLAMRLSGPLLLLVMISALMPLLFGWRPRQAIGVFAAIAVATVGLGVASLPNGPLASHTAAVTTFLDAQTKGVRQ